VKGRLFSLGRHGLHDAAVASSSRVAFSEIGVTRVMIMIPMFNLDDALAFDIVCEVCVGSQGGCVRPRDCLIP
jgi:hypothetical protein